MSRTEFWKDGGGPMRGQYRTDGPQVGWIVLGSGEIVPPEEYERRQAALTPAQRDLQDRITGHFKRMADELREAHEELKRQGR